MKAATICPRPGCCEVQPCPNHPRKPFAGASRSSDLYDSARWKRERAAFLKHNPRCVAPIRVAPSWRVCGEPSRIVDHTPPHRGDPDKFWDRSTWRALCTFHHNQNTGREVAARKATKR